MERKNIFVVTNECQKCGDIYYYTIAAYHNEEDAKKTMKKVSEDALIYFENEFPIDDIIVDENEHAIIIHVIDSDDYRKIEIKQITLY